MRKTKNETELGPLSALAYYGLRVGGFMGQYMGPRFNKEGEGEGGAGGGGAGAGKGASVDDDDKPTISQKKLNAILSEQAKKTATEQKERNDELLKSKNLTEKERKRLEEANVELKKVLTSKEEAAEEEKRNLVKQHEEEKANMTAESEGWKKQYFDSRVDTEITSAAVKFNAKNPKQIRKMLAKEAILEPRKGKDGEVIKKDGVVVYDLFVPHEETGKDGEIKTKKLTIEQKIAAMAASEEDGNLFNSERRGGTGHRQGSGGQGGSGGSETAVSKIGRGLAARFGPK